MSLQAYQQASARAESPRALEYRLFGQVTRALIDAAACDPLDVKTRMDALDWNRRLWSTLATDCASEENTLPNPRSEERRVGKERRRRGAHQPHREPREVHHGAERLEQRR